jgi:acyl-CoA synthetase (AMP-forming)/AMP-acid ligase II
VPQALNLLRLLQGLDASLECRKLVRTGNARPPMTLAELLAPHPADAVALRAFGADPLTYGALRALCAATGEALRAAGVGSADRVAIVLPNGPAMAAAFVAVAAAASVAPLNPAYTEAEFAFYMSDLGVRLLLTDDPDGPAARAAGGAGIAVAQVRPDGAAFTLDLPLGPAPDPAAPGAEALVLHTSGTTARPKIVPLSQANIAASARHIAASLALTPDDLGLNVMPLFHIHGLIASILASLSAGACVHVTPGFNALKHFDWLAEVRPTWVTAVPTMHQAILARAPRNREIVEAARLRFLRSSSASLPAPVLLDLERTFRCPVVEAYGMTEAAHQMTCNPLSGRKPGSVGPAAGPEVAILADTGVTTAPDTLGEVVIRGPNVTAGYAANPAANATAFHDGWFRTGDQGRLDADGFLWLTGRLKEIINRGGEKVSPREVDDVLMDHPAVALAVTFAIPHKTLGEEVGAAVVLRDGAQATAEDLRDFAAERLAAFKVPRRVLILDDIPKGPTGKLQRIGLAAKLGLGA